MNDPTPEASVARVRDELKRLGYLESGLDRFVLAGAGGRSLAATCLAVAWRVGMATGPLLGATLTLAAVSLDRRLLAEPTDPLVLAVYSSVALGLAAGAAAFAGGMTAAWLGRKAGTRAGATLARNVGLALALGGLAYLALWWRSRAMDAPLPAQAAALATGLCLSVVLGRFGSLAAVAVLSAAGRDRVPAASLTRRQMLISLALAAVLFAGGIAVSYSAERSAAAAPDYAVVPTGIRVRVVGVDGLERRMTDEMLERGEMPNLARLIADGARARLRVEPERVPAIVWTTVATGRGPEAHGIQSAGARRFAGMRTPVSLAAPWGRFASALGGAADVLRLTRAQPATAVLRGEKTFWNVASEKGLRVGVVNWWATWPAEAVNGYLVSDRAFFKMERGGAPDREVYPPEAFDHLRKLPRTDVADRPRQLDLFQVAAARALRGDAPADVEALYLPGLDIYTMQQMGGAAAADLAALEERLAGVRSYYRFTDGLIGEAAKDRGPAEVLVLVGDPGRLARSSSAPAVGTLVLAGGPVAPGDLGPVSERDVAPTVLHLAGLPTSRELPGAVLEAALGAEFRRSHPVRVVASLGRRATGRAAESAFDRDVFEELRSLGYIQ
jgi:type I phosphodiesterase/nucleotide pyrophosphatase